MFLNVLFLFNVVSQSGASVVKRSPDPNRVQSYNKNFKYANYMSTKLKYQIVYRGLYTNKLVLQEFDTPDEFNSAVADVRAHASLNLVFTNIYRE